MGLLNAWPVLIAVIVALVAALAGITASRSADPIRHVRGRLWLALGVFGLVLAGAWVWTVLRPGLLGLPIVVGPGAAAAAGVLAFALPPSRSPGAGAARRVATLRVRSAGQVLRGRALALPAALLVVLVAVLLTTGLTADSSGEAEGRAFTVTGRSIGASASPYPGWFYGGPILLTSVVLVVAVAVATRRTVLLPAVSTDDAVDRAWRAAVGRALGSIAAAGLLLYLAGVLWAAGAAWSVLAQTGTSGLEPVAVAQSVVAQLAALAAVVLLVVTAVRTVAVGRVLTAKPVAA